MGESWIATLGVAACLGLLAAAPARAAETPTLDEGLEPLRSDFNAEAENVRAVLLVGPT